MSDRCLRFNSFGWLLQKTFPQDRLQHQQGDLPAAPAQSAPVQVAPKPRLQVRQSKQQPKKAWDQPQPKQQPKKAWDRPQYRLDPALEAHILEHNLQLVSRPRTMLVHCILHALHCKLTGYIALHSTPTLQTSLFKVT